MSWLFALAALLRPNLTSDRISSAYHADYALSVTVHGRSLGAIKTSIDDGVMMLTPISAKMMNVH
jgi:hypothetical protein